MDGSSLLFCLTSVARLAQSVEHETLNLRVVGSSPTLGESPVLYPVETVSTIWSWQNERRTTVGRHGLVG